MVFGFVNCHEMVNFWLMELVYESVIEVVRVSSCQTAQKNTISNLIVSGL
jgi:hypothetical protein